METKSRYEIIAELEEKKANLLNAQAQLGLNEANLSRNIEKAREDLEEFNKGKDIQKENIKDQLASIETSLGRLSKK